MVVVETEACPGLLETVGIFIPLAMRREAFVCLSEWGVNLGRLYFLMKSAVHDVRLLGFIGVESSFIKSLSFSITSFFAVNIGYGNFILP